MHAIDQDNAVYTVSGSAKKNRIVVKADNVTIKLENASIELNECNGSPIEIAEGKTVTLLLSGDNKLTAYAAGPGVLVNQGATLTIRAADEEVSPSLTVSGAQLDEFFDSGGISGGLAGGYAGIGGPNSDSALNYTGTIKIESGTIGAFGYGYGAGIGGGDYSSGGTIEISGGNVTAINGGEDPNGWESSAVKQASGIGGSQGQASGNITISGSAVVEAYGGYSCAGIGGGTSNVVIKDSANVTAYGGEYAAGIGGYDKNKGNSSISVSDRAQVTAYGGKYASGLGRGSDDKAYVALSIADTAAVLAYSDGSKAPVTGTPQEGSAGIANLYITGVSLGDQDIPLTLTSESGDTKTITLKSGYKGVATTCTDGSYVLTVSTGQEGSAYRLIPSSGNTFLISVNNNDAYSGSKLMVMLVSDNGATVQLNPPSGKVIKSGDGAPLQFDEQNGTIVIPAGGTVDGVVWPAGGAVGKDGNETQTIIEVSDITIDSSTLTLYSNREPSTAVLHATITPDNASDKTVTWTSSDEGVATVDESGVVTAVANGRTAITASAGAHSATCSVTVTAYSTGGGGGVVTPSDKTEVEKNPDGSTTTTVTKPDGSQTITHETATGTESVVNKDKDGNGTSTKVSISKQDAASGKVELPLADAEPGSDVDKAFSVEIKVSSNVSEKAPVQVTVPVAKGEGDEPNYGFVVFAVNEDGNETLIPKTAVDDDGNVVFEVSGDVTIKVVDNAKDMPDVKETDWFAGDVVDFATARGIVNGIGMPDGTREFRGYGKTTRGMFVAMLHNLELNPKAAGGATLPDVPANAFYADAAAWALEEGVLSGVDMPDGTKQFQGEAAVTREQVAVFLMRYAQYLGMDVSARAEIDFPDAGEVSGFARDAMSWAVAEGLFTGNDATHELNPTDGAARAEVAAVLMCFINLMYA